MLSAMMSLPDECGAPSEASKDDLRATALWSLFKVQQQADLMPINIGTSRHKLQVLATRIARIGIQHF